MDDSRKSVTAGARGERTLIGAPRPAPRTTSHFTRRPRTASRPAPRRPRRVALACAALALLAVLATVAPEQAAAQSATTFISNAGQGNLTNTGSSTDRAQAFTTGATGGTLSSVEIIFADSERDAAAVSLCAVGTDGYPTTTCTALMPPGGSFTGGTFVLTAPANTMLAANTTYTLVIPSAGELEFSVTSSDGEDTGGATGWSIADSYFFKNSSNAWANTSTNLAFRITVKGTATSSTNTAPTGAPTITGTPTVGQTLTAVTTAIMDDDGLTTPGYTYQWIRVATDTTETNISSATANTYTLVTDDLGTTIKVKVSFTDDASNAETLTSVATAAVAAAPDTTPPTVFGTPVVVGLGTQIQMSFSEVLQQSNGPLASAFTVIVDGSPHTVSAVAFDPLFLSSVGLTVSPIRQGQAVVVTYTDPSGGDDARAIQDTAGNDVATFTTGLNSVPAVTNNSSVVPTAPGAPTGLTATASGSTQIDLSWTAPANYGGRVITGYKIEISPNGTDTWTTHVADTTSPNTTYEHTGLAASTTRHYRVSAINTIGTSTASNVDGATTGTTVPGAPTSLVATASGNTRIDLSWTAPVVNGGSDITGYKIEISSDGGNAWTTHLADTTDANTTYAHTGLAASTTRHYRVSAINTIGTSTASNVDDATTGTGTNTLATGALTITGTPQVGQTLTAVTTAIMDADGLNNVSYTYQWIQVDGGTETNISGAMTSTYTLVPADQGKTIKVTVRFTDDANNPETLTSVATAIVSAPSSPPTVLIRSLSVREDIGRAEVPVTLTWAAQVVLSVPWSTSELNAKSPDDYTDGQGSVTFAPGVTEATISIPIFDDAVRESEPEFFAVTLGTGEGYLLERNGRAGATVAILDNDGDGLLRAWQRWAVPCWS